MLIADLHIHSKYSRATSRDCVPEYLDFWARRKGISLVGTGDFTHPAWRAELMEKLVPAEEGLYTLREDVRFREDTAPEVQPRFVATGEISTIYKKNGRTRKVHSLILLPSLEAADVLARKLEAIGNIHSDGRPILGLDTRDLLEITLESCPEAVFIPAHIWTPHFSLFGAFSGFDAIEDCFEDLTPCIHALETGLSSDPPMNWRLSALDKYQLVSNSDAHSPAKLGREANLLDIRPSYPELAKALETGEGLAGTIEFFPEEGKYHLDGHRSCRMCLSPQETEAAGGRCPICGKKLTIGVLHRVEELADRAEDYVKPDAKSFESLVPLPEVIAASEGGSAAGGKVNRKYERMLRELGPEFHILREVPEADIGEVAGPLVAEGIRRLRKGEVRRMPGYDGAYGVIGLLEPAEREALNGQVSLFGLGEAPAAHRGRAAKAAKRMAEPEPVYAAPAGEGLNAEQREAVTAQARAVEVVAGPGTGKTKTLVARIAYLIEERGVKPGEITAVTFTNQAAGELRERLEERLGGRRAVHGMTIGTFHAICLDLLSKRPQGVRLIGSYEALEAAEDVRCALGVDIKPGKLLQEVSRRKNGLDTELENEVFDAYCAHLRELRLLDFDDLLLETLELWEKDGPRASAERRFTHLLVDEFQDCNTVQSRLLRAWGRKGKSLFVIGDPDQSVYGFRGSDPGRFQRVEEDLKDLATVRLVKNYRSTPEIVGCACLWGHRRALPHPAAGGAAGAVPESGRYPLCGGGPGGFPERRTGAGRAVLFPPPNGAGGHAVLPFRPDAGAGLPGGLGGGRPHTVDDAGGDRGGARPDAGGEIRPGSLGGELEPSGAESAAGPPAGKAWKTAGALGGRRRLRWGGTNPQAVEYGGFLSGYGGPASKSDVGPGAGPAAQRRTGVCVGGGDADDAPWLQGP